MGVGGPGGVRTLDLMTASHARSQLRHRPTKEIYTMLFVACGRRAVNQGMQWRGLMRRPFNLNLLLSLHSILLDSGRGRNKGKGHFRKVQNWIGLPGAPLEKAQFVPPRPETAGSYLG